MLNLLKKIQITVITELLFLIVIRYCDLYYYLFDKFAKNADISLWYKISVIITAIIIIIQIIFFIIEKKKEKKQG